jgi:hypothetical protein
MNLCVQHANSAPKTALGSTSHLTIKILISYMNLSQANKQRLLRADFTNAS